MVMIVVVEVMVVVAAIEVRSLKVRLLWGVVVV